MQIIELNAKELGATDIESGAILFLEIINSASGLADFGEKCVATKYSDGEFAGEFLISTWKSGTSHIKPITESEFWNQCAIKNYLETNTEIKPNNIKNILSFWDEWNNTFHVLELKTNQFYGVSWWTTV